MPSLDATEPRGDQSPCSGWIHICIDAAGRHRIQARLDQYRGHLKQLAELRATELAQAKEAAEAANQAKSELLASMSQEIHPSMRVIVGQAHLVRHARAGQAP
jgi:signal transduction histidine kinase